ncbi:MAG: NTP transferase domain-containing protein [Thermodesulfobacteriota bacterium]
MQAVILAAGYGSRLERVSNGLPKCLVPVGGRPLIEHQIEALNDAGIGRVLVVVGYKADAVRAELGDRVEFIENTRYDETNSLYSLWLARDWIEGPLVLMNCDLLFHPQILDRLLAKGGNGLAFDSSSTGGSEQTKVAVQEGIVLDIGKDLPPEATRGESIGLTCYDAQGVHLLMARADALISSGAENCWSIEAIRGICSNVKMKAYNVAGMPWVEVDFPNDLVRAEKEVWPAIHKSRWKRTVHWKTTKYFVMAIFSVLFLLGGIKLGHYSGADKVDWTSEPPINAEQALLKVPKGHQRWWESTTGKPLKVRLTGPMRAKAYMRLLLPPGTVEPGKYVVQVSIDGKPYAWSVFKATPDEKVFFEGAVVGDRDRVDVEVPEGAHIVELALVAGVSKRFLGRIRYPEPISGDVSKRGD